MVIKVMRTVLCLELLQCGRFDIGEIKMRESFFLLPNWQIAENVSKEKHREDRVLQRYVLRSAARLFFLRNSMINGIVNCVFAKSANDFSILI